MFTLKSALNSLLLLTLMALMVSGCYYDVAEELYPVTGSVAPCDSNPSYNSFIKPLMDTKCTGCHQPGGTSPDLTTYSSVKAKAVSISGRINRNSGDPLLMPQNGPKLDTCNLKSFQLWIDKGCPQ